MPDASLFCIFSPIRSSSLHPYLQPVYFVYQDCFYLRILKDTQEIPGLGVTVNAITRPTSHCCDESLLVWLSLRITYFRYFFTMVNCHAPLPFAVFYVQISHHLITPTNHPLKNCWRVRLSLGLKSLLYLVCHKLSGLSFVWIPSPLPVYHPTNAS